MRGPIQLLTDAFELFKKDPKHFIGLYAIIGLLIIGAEILTLLAAQFPGVAILIVVYALAMIYAIILVAVAMMRSLPDPHAFSIKGSLQEAKPMVWQYLLVTLLVGLVTGFGFMLLIIPGIIFMVWFLFATYFLVFDGIKGTAAMGASKELVKGNFFPVLGRYLFLGVIAVIAAAVASLFGYLADSELLASLVTVILNIVFVPVALGYTYYMFTDLKALKESAGTLHENERSESEEGKETEDVGGRGNEDSGGSSRVLA